MDRVFIWNLEDTIIIFAMILAQDHLPDLAQHTQYKVRWPEQLLKISELNMQKVGFGQIAAYEILR